MMSKYIKVTGRCPVATMGQFLPQLKPVSLLAPTERERATIHHRNLVAVSPCRLTLWCVILPTTKVFRIGTSWQRKNEKKKKTK